MYLSSLKLNPRNRSVQRDIGSARQMHRTVLHAFPDDLKDERVLYRVDQGAEAHQISLLVQSHISPDWSNLEHGYLVAAPDGVAMKQWQFQPTKGQRLAFRLRANPTKRLSAGKGNKGKRIGLYKLEEQINWLQRKATDHGFAIQTAMPTQQQRVDDRRQDLKFFSVQFDGILQVTDPPVFLAAIQLGIGSGKAFGFGLLSVAPVG